MTSSPKIYFYVLFFSSEKVWQLTKTPLRIYTKSFKPYIDLQAEYRVWCVKLNVRFQFWGNSCSEMKNRKGSISRKLHIFRYSSALNFLFAFLHRLECNTPYEIPVFCDMVDMVIPLSRMYSETSLVTSVIGSTPYFFVSKIALSVYSSICGKSSGWE